MRYVLAAVAALAGSTAATGQDAAFTGARVEGLIGYDSADVTGEANGGLLYGAGLGFDVQSGAALFGAEAEITDSKADRCEANFAGSAGTLCADVGRDLYVGARVGALVGPRVLLYAKGGYTNARLRTDYSTGVVGAGNSRSMKLDGFRLGGGAELAIGPNSFVKTEYRYSSYGQGNDFVGGTALNPVLLPGDRHTKHQIVGGFGFRF